MEHILVYVKGTKHYEVIYKGSSSLESIRYVNSEYASYRDTRQLTKENIFLVANGLISWKILWYYLLCKVYGIFEDNYSSLIDVQIFLQS